MTASADISIRLARATFNRALADADLPAIGSLLARDVILVTGSDSAVIAGRKAQLDAWKREFAARPRTIYTRIPADISVSAAEPIAMETGTWQGSYEGAGKPSVSGSDAAKWRLVDGAWRLVAEIFVTLA